ncbi:MAG: putative coiled-coil protein SlyX [Planctomycetaceae bacterium]
MAGSSVIQRLRQNAVNLMVKDQDVKQLADIVAELCMVCEDQQKRIDLLNSELESLRGAAVE